MRNRHPALAKLLAVTILTGGAVVAGRAGADTPTIRIEAERASVRTVGGVDGPGWNLWSAGRIEETVVFRRKGDYLLTVRARANSQRGVEPVLEVLIDGKKVGQAAVAVERGWAYRDYVVPVSTTRGRHKVALVFVNDPNESGNNVDLIIDRFEIVAVDTAPPATSVVPPTVPTVPPTLPTVPPTVPSVPPTPPTVPPTRPDPVTTTTGAPGGSGGGLGDSTSPYVPSGYALTWHDEFDTLSLDKSANGSGNWATKFVGFNVLSLGGNGDRCMKAYPEFTGTGGPPLGIETHRVNDGMLTLLGHPLPENRRAQFWNYDAACGMISGQLSHSQTYGYWEIRMRVTNVSQGHHWGVWMLPADNAWPPEIDILEVVGAKPGDTNVGPSRFHFTGHFNDANGAHTGNGRAINAPGAPNDWYTLGLEWTANEVIWRVNGKEVHRLGNFFGPRPAYLLITPEIGGNWPGPTTSRTTWPMSMDVDYVRIYSR